jgi:hypothetical protein
MDLKGIVQTFLIQPPSIFISPSHAYTVKKDELVRILCTVAPEELYAKYDATIVIIH